MNMNAKQGTYVVEFVGCVVERTSVLGALQKVGFPRQAVEVASTNPTFRSGRCTKGISLMNFLKQLPESMNGLVYVGRTE